MRSIDYFDKQADLHPDKLVLIAGDARYTYAEMRALSHRLAGAMLANGLAHQEPVAILSPNHGSILTTLFGLWRAGAVWIPVNTRNALDANVPIAAYEQAVEASHVFNLLQARGVISVQERASYMARVRDLARGSCEAHMAKEAGRWAQDYAGWAA